MQHLNSGSESNSDEGLELHVVLFPLITATALINHKNGAIC